MIYPWWVPLGVCRVMRVHAWEDLRSCVVTGPSAISAIHGHPRRSPIFLIARVRPRAHTLRLCRYSVLLARQGIWRICFKNLHLGSARLGHGRKSAIPAAILIVFQFDGVFARKGTHCLLRTGHGIGRIEFIRGITCEAYAAESW